MTVTVCVCVCVCVQVPRLRKESALVLGDAVMRSGQLGVMRVMMRVLVATKYAKGYSVASRN